MTPESSRTTLGPRPRSPQAVATADHIRAEVSDPLKTRRDIPPIYGSRVNHRNCNGIQPVTDRNSDKVSVSFFKSEGHQQRGPADFQTAAASDAGRNSCPVTAHPPRIEIRSSRRDRAPATSAGIFDARRDGKPEENTKWILAADRTLRRAES